MKKPPVRAIAASLSSLAVAAALFAGAPAAQAADSVRGYGCPLGYLCIWDDASFRTAEAGSANENRAYVKFQRYISNYSAFLYERTNLGSTNRATSIVNNGRYDTAYMYADPNKRTLLFSIPVAHDNWALWGSQGDNIESGYFRTYN